MAGKSEMIYNHLGGTGLKVSALSYGSWVTFSNQLDTSKAKALMGQCFDAGVNFFDNAEAYAGGKSEVVMGEAIKELGWKRSDVVLSTKIFWGGKGPNDKGLSRKHIIEGTKASLKRMDQEYVDLLFAHRPDPDTPIEETLSNLFLNRVDVPRQVRAFNHCIDQGWALYWGTSEWSAQQITQAWEVARRLDLIGPAMEQPEYNLFTRQKVEVDYKPLYKEYGLGTTIWSPLAYGMLSGKYSLDSPPAPDSRFAMDSYSYMAKENIVKEKISKVDALRPIAKDLDCSLAQLSLAWAASNPDVSTVIMGATKSEQLTDNLGALAVIPKITPEVRERIEAAVETKPKA